MSELPKQSDSVSSTLDSGLKAKWLEALRSGQYQQGKGYLHRNGGYCCLGVLACVSGEPLAEIDGKTSLLAFSPLEAMLDPGMTRPVQCHLENMNDKGKSFAEIADWIEANL